MNLKKLLRKLRARLRNIFGIDPVFKKVPECELEFAFECDGSRFYTPKTAGELPAARALMSHVFTKQVELRMTHEFQVEWLKALRAHTHGKSFNISSLTYIHKLELMMEERMNLPFEPETVLRLATVLFIEENENPNVFEEGFNEKKFHRFKNDPAILPFVLRHRILDLMPYLEPSDIDIQDYLQVVELITSQHWKQLQEIISTTTLPLSPVKN